MGQFIFRNFNAGIIFLLPRLGDIGNSREGMKMRSYAPPRTHSRVYETANPRMANSPFV